MMFPVDKSSFNDALLVYFDTLNRFLKENECQQEASGERRHLHVCDLLLWLYVKAKYA